jgi:hypothetical protein
VSWYGTWLGGVLAAPGVEWKAPRWTRLSHALFIVVQHGGSPCPGICPEIPQ